MTQKKFNVTPAVLLVITLFICILVYAFYLRRLTFWLPHWKGDQNHYISLAMKLDNFGLDGYNFKKVRLRYANRNFEGNDVQLVFAAPGRSDEDSDTLKILRGLGQSYYDEPLHMRAPLFSYLLMWSHRWFADQGQPYIAVGSNLGTAVRFIRPKLLAEVQRWVVRPVLAVNILVIAMCFFLGLVMFNARVGLYSAFLMATNPVNLFTGHRVFADDFALLWLTLSLLLFYVAYSRNSSRGIFFAGLVAGLGVLSKQTAFFSCVIVWFYTLMTLKKPLSVRESLTYFVNKPAVIFGIAMGLVSAFWFLKVWQVYGTPFHMPDRMKMLEGVTEDTSGWFQAVYGRPHPAFLFSIGFLYFSPLLGLAYASLGLLRKKVKRLWEGLEQQSPTVFLWIWVLVIYLHFVAPWDLLNFNGNREHRYFYLAYPAIIALACFVLDKLRERLGNWIKVPYVADLVVILILAKSAHWSIPIGMKYVFANELLM